MEDTQKAQIALLISTFIWGITPIFIEIALDYFSPLYILTIRFGLGVLALSLFLPLIKKRNGLSLLTSKPCVVVGWLYAFGYLTATIGQKMTTPGLATLISTSYVIIVPFISKKLEKTELSPKIMIIAFISIIGIFLICYNGDIGNFSNLSSLGTVFLLLAALLWGFDIVISSKFLDRSKFTSKSVDLLSYLYASLFHTFLPLFLLSMFISQPVIRIPQFLILILVFLGFFPTIIAYSLYNWAIARVGSVKTSFYLVLQVIVPFVFELIFIGYFYSLWVYSGIILILIAIFWVNRNSSSSHMKKSNNSVLIRKKIIYKKTSRINI